MDYSNYIIDSANLRYDSYIQPRGDGFSGQLLLATETNNSEKKYIIKAGAAHVAACDFMFCHFAEKLCLPVAHVRFVNPIKPNEFEYPACAVEFIPNAVKLSCKEFMGIEDCVKLSCLSYILGDGDNLDFLRDESGTVYKIDHSDCFGIEGTAETWINPKNPKVQYMFYQMSKTVPKVGYYAEMTVLQNMFKLISRLKLTDFNDEFSLLSKFCGKQFETHFRFYLSKLIIQCANI